MTRPIASLGPSRAVVVGSGIAGLTAALHLGQCTVVTKSALAAGASGWAQGGLAAALGADDRPALHAADTVAVSGGLADPEIADLVAADAPSRVRWLETIGTRFDLDTNGALALGREAGHRVRRVVHAGGDATGAEIMRALAGAVRDRGDIELIEDTTVVDLLWSGEHVAGVVALTARAELVAMPAPAVVLAAGGIGRVYASTTNPVEATGDGLAIAARAGAVIRDPEFVQFHPTALDSSIDPKPLLTEALRGDGAVLIDHRGQRYMVDEHPDAELAPRDVVARASWRARREGPIFLDVRSLGSDFSARFPTVAASAAAAGLDPRRDPLPVVPAQHYHMGGIATDALGRSSLHGLFACGENAATGLHGANRLASNSLLEGLVFGTRVAECIRTRPVDDPPERNLGDLAVPAGALELDLVDDAADIDVLREMMWSDAGLVRSDTGLRHGVEVLGRLRSTLDRSPVGRNLAEVASLILEAAIGRRESRGGHHRSDHPDPDPAFAAPTLLARERTPLLPVAVREAAVSH